MKIHQLAAALQSLREAITGNMPRGTAAVLLSVMAACCALLVTLCEQLRRSEDPRVAACQARLIEELARLAHREQLHAIIRCESTGAHLLDDDSLAALGAWRTAPQVQLDLAQAPTLITGRAHYQDTADFTASWLGLNYHEAAARLAAAHLVIARRHSDGREITPRHASLAQLFANPGDIEPRRILGAARALERFEPKDTAHDGLPLLPTATHPDGALLESHIVAALREPNRSTSEKRVSALLGDYRQQHAPAKPTPIGLFYRGQRGTAECWEVLAEGEQAEQMHSMANQADNPRTEAGKAARQNSSANAGDDPFTSDQPAPDWAGITDDDSPAPSPEEPARQMLAGDGQATPAQRRLNAFLAALGRMTTGDAADTPGKTITPQVAIHVKLDSLEDLREQRNLTGVTAHGVKLDAAMTSKLICQGEIYRVVFGPDGQPLDVGRSQRFFTEAIKKAAFARDGGCIVPGCTAPPEMIEYHHDDWWSRGGRTSCSNASCLCRRHHLAVHAGLLTLVKINGLAHILFPKHLDPSQTPARNQLKAAA